MNKEFRVEGMSCGHCKASVEQALGQLPGISAVEVDLEGKRVQVEVDLAVTTEEQIRQTITDIGFEVGQG